MKLNEFAFFNQQLANLLRSGVPLEGSLRRLCLNMRRGRMRAEIERLTEDLERGTPLTTALDERNLPEIYKRMVAVGAKNDFASILKLLADYYRQMNDIRTRVRGLLFYPLLVLSLLLTVSIFLSLFFEPLLQMTLQDMHIDAPKLWYHSSMLPIVTFSAMLVLALLFLRLAPLRRFLHWHLPVFKQAAIARVAATIAVLLRTNCPLDEAIAMTAQIERGTPAQREMDRWCQRIAEGETKFAQIANDSKIFPQVFVWFVDNHGENIAAGFATVSEVYDQRAKDGADAMVHGLLPVSMFFTGAVIVAQMSWFLAPLLDLLKQVE